MLNQEWVSGHLVVDRLFQMLECDWSRTTRRNLPRHFGPPFGRRTTIYNTYQIWPACSLNCRPYTYLIQYVNHPAFMMIVEVVIKSSFSWTLKLLKFVKYYVRVEIKILVLYNLPACLCRSYGIAVYEVSLVFSNHKHMVWVEFARSSAFPDILHRWQEPSIKWFAVCSPSVPNCSLLIHMPNCFDQETGKWPFRSSSRAATRYYQSSHSKVGAIPLSALDGQKQANLPTYLHTIPF